METPVCCVETCYEPGTHGKIIEENDWYGGVRVQLRVCEKHREELDMKEEHQVKYKKQAR